MSDVTEEITAAEENVEGAISSVEKAADDAPTQETEVALEEISRVLEEARGLLAQINSKVSEEVSNQAEAEHTTSEGISSGEHTAASEPDVAVGEGKQEYRYVRRFGRKVKRKA